MKPLLFNMVLEVLITEISQEKEIKSSKSEKKRYNSLQMT